MLVKAVVVLLMRHDAYRPGGNHATRSDELGFSGLAHDSAVPVAGVQVLVILKFVAVVFDVRRLQH